MTATIYETLLAVTSDSMVVARAKELLARSGLAPLESWPTKRTIALKRLAALRPEVTWLAPGEKAHAVERKPAESRPNITTTCHFDRVNHVVAVHHVRGKEGDADFDAWADVKRFETLLKAEEAWLQLAKKHRFSIDTASR